MRFLDDAEIERMKDDLDKFMKLYKYSMLRPQSRQSLAMGMSPTDVDARGRYTYQEPEVDEQGTYYGYKVLHTCPDRNCRDRNCRSFVSPRYSVHWNENGCLRADAPPGGNHMHGIHCTKSPDHPELENYRPTPSERSYRGCESFLVKCALSGIVVETEQGFRAEHAQIIGVYEDGNWKSYQDYQERSRPNSRTNPFEEDSGWRYYYNGIPSTGIWHANYYYPSADS